MSEKTHARQFLTMETGEFNKIGKLQTEFGRFVEKHSTSSKFVNGRERSQASNVEIT